VGGRERRWKEEGEGEEVGGAEVETVSNLLAIAYRNASKKPREVKFIDQAAMKNSSGQPKV